MSERKQCVAKIGYRDPVLRYTGRTRSGFEREWTWRQCKRQAQLTGDLCGVHRNQELRIFVPKVTDAQ